MRDLIEIIVLKELREKFEEKKWKGAFIGRGEEKKIMPPEGGNPQRWNLIGGVKMTFFFELDWNWWFQFWFSKLKILNRDLKISI